MVPFSFPLPWLVGSLVFFRPLVSSVFKQINSFFRIREKKQKKLFLPSLSFSFFITALHSPPRLPTTATAGETSPSPRPASPPPPRRSRSPSPPRPETSLAPRLSPALSPSLLLSVLAPARKPAPSLPLPASLLPSRGIAWLLLRRPRRRRRKSKRPPRPLEAAQRRPGLPRPRRRTSRLSSRLPRRPRRLGGTRGRRWPSRGRTVELRESGEGFTVFFLKEEEEVEV